MDDMKACLICGSVLPDCDFYKGQYRCKSCVSRWNKQYRELNKEKIKAHNKLNQTIRKGLIIVPNDCFSCGKQCKPDAHHTDYSKPLDVIWFCRKCHKTLHQEMKDATKEDIKEKRTGDDKRKHQERS